MINIDKLIESCNTIAHNVMFEGHDGNFWTKGNAWLFDQAMRALDTRPSPLSVTFAGRCRYAGDVYVTIRRDGSYAIRRKETVDKYGIETV